jgi:photosystem II stability/assembly factor-like uncharacterized protein
MGLRHHPARMMRRLVVLFLLALSIPVAAQRRRAVRSPERFPQCSMITGTAAVTFTLDEGRTLAPSAQSPRPISYTYGLAAMIDEPNTLVAWHGDDLLLSTDAGCSWRVEATVAGADFPPSITPAKGGRAYAWSENRSFTVRYDARGAVKLTQPVDFVGLGADPANGEHVRAGGVDGSIWDSTDGGETWTQIAVLPEQAFVYRFTFDPKHLDHIVAGTVTKGAYVSRDAGATWIRATGFEGSFANVFQLVYSPLDSNRVWAMGIDTAKRIFVSDDGGQSYTAVVTERPGVDLINGPTMAAHPTNRDVLYFVFGTHIFQYGADVYRYDHATKTLRVAHNDQHDVNAIAFSRKDPNVMYLGLERFQ